MIFPYCPYCGAHLEEEPSDSSDIKAVLSERKAEMEALDKISAINSLDDRMRCLDDHIKSLERRLDMKRTELVRVEETLESRVRDCRTISRREADATRTLEEEAHRLKKLEERIRSTRRRIAEREKVIWSMREDECKLAKMEKVAKKERMRRSESRIRIKDPPRDVAVVVGVKKDPEPKKESTDLFHVLFWILVLAVILYVIADSIYGVSPSTLLRSMQAISEFWGEVVNSELPSWGTERFIDEG